MRKLAEICIHRPVFAAMLILALVVVGSAAYFRLGVDRFPSVDLPTVSIRTNLPGASPEVTETEITQRIEDVVNTVDGIEELWSSSGTGSSNVRATFRLDRDIESATQDIRDKVATVLNRLPDDADPPIISKFDNDSRPVLTLALSGQRSVRELTEIADKLVKRQLERANGVGEVAIVGGLDRTINIWVDAQKLAAYQLPITAIRDAVVAQNSEVPGGNITGREKEQVLRTMGRITEADDFNEIIVATVNGAPVRIKDLGRAEDGTREQRTVARLNGMPTVSLDVRRQSGANTVEVIEDVKRKLELARRQLPPGMELLVINDQSNYIYAALHEINSHLIVGSILACLVVLAFMRSWRSVIIAGVAIPASVISTFGVMKGLHFTLNSVTMLALVLMVGIVIDDAIVILENIFRMVEEKKLTPMQGAREGVAEIGLAVLATTLSLVVIFIPVSFMSSISGRFLYQFGITAAVAVMISLLVSFTLTPTLAARMLKPDKLHSHAASRTGFYGIIDRAYTALLRLAIAWRIPVAILALCVMGSSYFLYKMVRQDYLPSDVDEAEFSVGLNAPEGTAFPAMDRAMQSIEKELMDMPEVRTILASAGGGWLGGANNGWIYVRMAPHEERRFSFTRLWHATLKGDPLSAWRGNYTQRDVMEKIRGKLRKYRDLRCSVGNLVAFSIGGGNIDIALTFRGPDLEMLSKCTEELRRQTLSGEIPGIRDADTSLRLNKPEARVTLDRERAATLGVSPRDMGTALNLMIGGSTSISRFRDPDTSEDYDVALRLTQRQRDNPGSLPQLLLPRKNGVGLIELRNIASVAPGQGPARIERLNRQRAASFRARVAPGFALADRLQAVQDAVGRMNLSSEYSTSVSGQGRELERTFYEFIWAFALSIVFMYMILASNYESLIHPLTILLSLPLSVPFALFSLWFMGGSLNLYSALGVLVLFGVVKKNAILQIDHMNQLRREAEADPDIVPEPFRTPPADASDGASATANDHAPASLLAYADASVPPAPLHPRTRWERRVAAMPEHKRVRLWAIIQGNRDRLRPILMTTLTLVAGMAPMALGTGSGAEERKAVAIVVIGGQSLCLLLTLLVTPVAYSLFDDIGGFLSRRFRHTPVAQPAPRELAPVGVE